MNESNQKIVEEIATSIRSKVKDMQSLERVMRKNYLVKYDEYCMTEIRQFVDLSFLITLWPFNCVTPCQAF